MVVGTVHENNIRNSFKYGQTPLIVSTKKKSGYILASHISFAVLKRLKVNNDGSEMVRDSFSDMYKSTVAPLLTLLDNKRTAVPMIKTGIKCREKAEMAVLRSKDSFMGLQLRCPSISKIMSSCSPLCGNRGSVPSRVFSTLH